VLKRIKALEGVQDDRQLLTCTSTGVKPVNCAAGAPSAATFSIQDPAQQRLEKLCIGTIITCVASHCAGFDQEMACQTNGRAPGPEAWSVLASLQGSAMPERTISKAAIPMQTLITGDFVVDIEITGKDPLRLRNL
jgi:hypothetical protein